MYIVDRLINEYASHSCVATVATMSNDTEDKTFSFHVRAMLSIMESTTRWQRFSVYIRTIQRTCVWPGCGHTNETSEYEFGNPLVVHHIHYETLGRETRDDVMVLCPRCHRLEHERWSANQYREAEAAIVRAYERHKGSGDAIFQMSLFGYD